MFRTPPQIPGAHVYNVMAPRQNGEGTRCRRSLSPRVRWVMVTAGETVLLVTLIGIFWYQDWRYSLPTPRPKLLEQPAVGTRLDLPESLQSLLAPTGQRPVLLHFINPDCPCSRFNLEHVRRLQQEFGQQVDIVAVTEGANVATLHEHFARLHWQVPVVWDTSRSLAKLTGVYATPQAVVLDSQRRLFYRGNYNTSRYCTAEETEFARIALDALLKQTTNPVIESEQATRSYGCALPVCTLEGTGL